MTEEKRPVIMDRIPEGRQNAIAADKLAAQLRESTRELRKDVESARRKGYIIASCIDGYYIPVTDEELISYYRMHKRRALTALVCTEPIRKKLRAKGYKVKGSKVTRA